MLTALTIVCNQGIWWTRGAFTTHGLCGAAAYSFCPPHHDIASPALTLSRSCSERACYPWASRPPSRLLSPSLPQSMQSSRTFRGSGGENSAGSSGGSQKLRTKHRRASGPGDFVRAGVGRRRRWSRNFRRSGRCWPSRHRGNTGCVPRIWARVGSDTYHLHRYLSRFPGCRNAKHSEQVLGCF
jgi:hypothetical protein